MDTAPQASLGNHWQETWRGPRTIAYTAPTCDDGWAYCQPDGDQPARLAFFTNNRLLCEMTGNPSLLDTMAAAYAQGTLIPMGFITLDTTPEQWCLNAERRLQAADKEH